MCDYDIYYIYIYQMNGGLKMKNKILYTINIIVAIVFCVFATALDSESNIPFIVCLICAIWMVLMLIANFKK